MPTPRQEVIFTKQPTKKKNKQKAPSLTRHGSVVAALSPSFLVLMLKTKLRLFHTSTVKPPRDKTDTAAEILSSSQYLHRTNMSANAPLLILIFGAPPTGWDSRRRHIEETAELVVFTAHCTIKKEQQHLPTLVGFSAARPQPIREDLSASFIYGQSDQLTPTNPPFTI